jgi:trigger factor
MKFTVEKIQTNLVTLEIEVEEPRVEEALEQSYRKMVKKINIPGFRKGKVPRQIFESQVGREALYEEALEILLNQTYLEVIKEAELETIGDPKVEVVQIDRGLPLIYKAVVSVKPEIEVPSYKGIEIEDEVAKEPTEEDVQKILENFQKQMARLENLESGPVENGQIVQLDFVGYLDGVAFEGGTSVDYSLEIGSKTFIPGFEEQLLGLQIDEEKDVEVVFPEEYPQPELAGKPCIFKVKIKGIKKREFPVIDDEFAKDVSESETLVELKQEIINNLKEKSEKEAKQDLREKVIEKVVDQVEVEVPEPMVEDRLKEMVTKFSQQMSMQGTTLEQYLQMTGKSMGELLDYLKPQAEKWAKTTLVLETIAKAENITVSDEDVEERITRVSEEYGMKREDVSKSVENLGESFKMEILLDKVINFVLGQVQIIPPTV